MKLTGSWQYEPVDDFPRIFEGKWRVSGPHHVSPYMERKRLRPGTRLGRYEIRGHLGAGAMAQVYLAVDDAWRRTVALKVLEPGFAPSSQLARRFEREALAMSSSNHPNIVSVHEVGWHDRCPFIAMEFVAGRTLREILDNGPLDLATVLDWGLQLAEGLAAAHAAGIVHRDLKPENVMVTHEGRVKILDFGLSKQLGRVSDGLPGSPSETEEVLTLPGTILGTLQYMSPEQASGTPVDYRADQFALGAILHEMVTGIVPFRRNGIPYTLAAILEGEPAGREQFLARAPLELTRIVDRALRKSPANRFAAMTDLGDALRKVQRARARKPGRLGAAMAAVLSVAEIFA